MQSRRPPSHFDLPWQEQLPRLWVEVSKAPGAIQSREVPPLLDELIAPRALVEEIILLGKPVLDEECVVRMLVRDKRHKAELLWRADREGLFKASLRHFKDSADGRIINAETILSFRSHYGPHYVTIDYARGSIGQLCTLADQLTQGCLAIGHAEARRPTLRRQPQLDVNAIMRPQFTRGSPSASLKLAVIRP